MILNAKKAFNPTYFNEGYAPGGLCLQDADIFLIFVSDSYWLLETE